jgi:hypothetical protein
MLIDHRRRRSATMTSRTTTTRTIRLAIATAAAMMLMSQAAQARPIVPIGAQIQTAPSSSPYQGTYRPATDVVTQPPDRTDLIGTSRAVLGQPTVTAKTAVVAHTTTNGFDWTAATVGAGSTLIVVLIAGAGLAARGRRRVPLSA